MTEILQQVAVEIGNVFESLANGVYNVIGDAGEFLGNLS